MNSVLSKNNRQILCILRRSIVTGCLFLISCAFSTRGHATDIESERSPGTSTDAGPSEYCVGLAKVQVTPKGPIAMCGYGPRICEGVLDDLYAKAMVIEHANGERAVLITADLLFFRAPMAEAVCKRIMAKTGLERRQILLNASHTHSGPVFGLKDPDRADLSKEERNAVDEYTQRLLDQLVELVVAALKDVSPARLSQGIGTAGDFVMNRRLLTPEGKCRGMGPNPEGPVDRDVPVLRVDSPDGRLRALLFGCACHPVTLDGNYRKISGDYASFAQRYIEEQHPGVQAMFLIGCGADANSHPRGGPEQEAWVRKHGDRLGSEVCRIADSGLRPINGPLKVLFRRVALPLEHKYSSEQLRKIVDSRPSYWHARNAECMLATLERNESLPTHYDSSIALWRFGDDLTLVGLPGEAVADYAGAIQKAVGGDNPWIAAYCNESFGYLPTAKMLPEGGHETMGLTLAVGFFSAEVEGVVIGAVRRLAREASRASP